MSEQFSSVYRDTKLPKHPDGKWRFPCDTVATKPYGRRLMYDATHPDAMYASQWSSELADPPGPYSFATTTGLPAELPWTKDLNWQVTLRFCVRKLLSVNQIWNLKIGFVQFQV